MDASQAKLLYEEAIRLIDQGFADRAIQNYRSILELDPFNLIVRSSIACLICNIPSASPVQILQENIAFSDCISRRPVSPHANDLSPNRRLRVGYVSLDFRRHIVGINVFPLFSLRDRRQFKTYAYSTLHPSDFDSMTKRFRAKADVWRTIHSLSDEAVEGLIRKDEIDILVDLSLHTNANRLPVFAHKPAPIQVTFAGYPGTTGVPEIDYRLTDPYLDPMGMCDEFYAEKSIRLPHSFWNYDPDFMGEDKAPILVDSPVLTNGFITFGSLNHPRKINEPCLNLWRSTLDAVPNSKMIMIAPEGAARDHARKLLGNRVDFICGGTRSAYMSTYNRIDIVLDPIPYNGHTTSQDALWMGVPLVTLVGSTVVGRAGVSLLSNLGLTDLIAESPEQYIRIAADLAADIPRLIELRRTLRDRMRTSPLMDTKGFVAGIEAAYRRMWLDYIAGRSVAVEPESLAG